MEDQVTDSLDNSAEDQQLLEEIITNERIIQHSKLGTIRLMMPTLEMQRKIDLEARRKKKELKMAYDEFPDENDETVLVRVPAYKSRDVLMNEYLELGWWTTEKDEKLNNFVAVVTAKLTELELLGFEDEEEIYNTIGSIRKDLEDIFREVYVAEDEEIEKEETSKEETEKDEEENEYDSKILPAIVKLTGLGGDYDHETDKFLRREAPSTEVDDILDELQVQVRIYKALEEALKIQTELLTLQAEYYSLFGDSWQDQLQYFIRLAQVYQCARKAETGQHLWPSIKAIEQETDVESVRWLFTELDAFFKGFTDDVREKMDKYSFMYGRGKEPEQLEESPAPTESKQDGDIPESEEIPSSEVTDMVEPSQSDKSDS